MILGKSSLNGGILQQAMFACQRVNQIPLFGGSYRPGKTRVDKHDKTHVLATLGLFRYIYIYIQICKCQNLDRSEQKFGN